jgi:hypothetical protein
VKVRVGTPAGSVGVKVVGEEFLAIPVEEGVEVASGRYPKWLTFETCFDDAKAVEEIEVEQLPPEPHGLLLWER